MYEARIAKLEKQVARLSRRAAAFKPPDGPAEVAMELMTLQGGELVDPELFYWHYEAVGWKRGRQKLQNWRALLMTWVIREREKKDREPDSWED